MKLCYHPVFKQPYLGNRLSYKVGIGPNVSKIEFYIPYESFRNWNKSNLSLSYGQITKKGLKTYEKTQGFPFKQP